jgi:hypothetical protein
MFGEIPHVCAQKSLLKINSQNLKTAQLTSNARPSRVLRTKSSQEVRPRCFTKDEGRPLGVGLQEQASNKPPQAAGLEFRS